MKQVFFKRSLALALAIVLALGMAATALAAARPQDDFYDSVNGDWIAKTAIPADQVAVGAGTDLAMAVEATLIADFAKMRSGDTSTSDPRLKEFLKMYGMALDFQRRQQEGATPALKRLARIEALTGLEQFTAAYPELLLDGYSLPYTISVTVDMKNTDSYMLYAGNAGVVLPDPAYYGTESGDAMLGVFAQGAAKVLALMGKSEAEASALVQQCLAFDAVLANYQMDPGLAGDYVRLYNPVSYAKFKGYSKKLALDKSIAALTDVKVSKVMVPNEPFFKALDKIVNEENFENMRGWMVVNAALGASSYLTEEMRVAASQYQMMLYGIEKLTDQKRTAYYLAKEYFGDVVGQYYGRTYFGAQAREEVTAMTNAMIAEYRERLASNDFLSDATKTMAIKKLDTIEPRIGYPDKVNPIYDKFIIDESATLFDNAMRFSRINVETTFAYLGKKVDHSLWVTPGDTVDAYYNPMSNTITFPAGILQAPFYSSRQSDSANYGGVGMIIGHEISHAFDPNGSKFDEKGNLRNWWTKKDFAAFDKRAQAVIAQYDGLPYGGGKVDGTLTQAENIADLAGLSVALSVVKKLPDANVSEFFTQYAKIWRIKMTPEMQAMYLYDVHAPQPLRVNVPVSNFEEFHEAFGVKEGDGMYRAPADRVQIW